MRAILIPLVLLAACQRQETPPERTAALEPSAAPAPPAQAGTALPPADAEYRYIGNWAADAAACADPPWRFEARRLTTKGEVACAFDRVGKTPAGYEIAATCTAEAPPAPYVIRLSFAESARAMLVEGGPFSGPVGLVWCGPP
jgi:hypothetical protein